MEKIYNHLDEADFAYLLKNGTVYFEIKDKEIYKITGKSLIVGANEIILNYDPDKVYYREFNFYKDENAELAKISPENLKKLINKYTVGYNMNIFFAEMIRITNKILAKRQTSCTKDVTAVHEISKLYYETTNSLLELGEKTRFPDLKSLAAKQSSELIFETGKIFSHEKSSTQLEVKKEKLDDFNISFAPNSIICKEGDEGNEMYILNSGRIGILIGNEQVAEINEKGTVIGEIALLLGEKRTATLKAIDQVTLSIIKKDNLVEFHKTHEDIFLHMGITLSHGIHNNFQIIRNIDDQCKIKTDQKVAGFLDRNRAERYILELKKNVTDLYESKEYVQLPELIEKLETGVSKYVGL